MQVSFWKRYDKFHILLHVLAWLGFLSLPALFIGNGGIGILFNLSIPSMFFNVCIIYANITTSDHKKTLTHIGESCYDELRLVRLS